MDELKMQNGALILEGGSLRSLFTSGVLDVFMEHNLYFSDVTGVSAGSLTGVNYVSRQPGRSAKLNIDYVNDKRYLGVNNLILHHEIDPAEVAARKAPFDEFTAELAAFIIGEVVEIRAERKRGRLPKAVPVDILPGLEVAVQRVVFGFIRRGEEMLALHAQGAYFFIVHYGFPFVSARHIRHCSTRAPCGVSPCSGSIIKSSMAVLSLPPDRLTA